MTNDDKDQKKTQDKKKTLSGGNTLSLKGFDPNALKRNLDNTGAGGPVVEHKRRRRSSSGSSGGSLSRSNIEGNSAHIPKKQNTKSQKPVSTPRQSSGLSLSVAEMEARKKALSMAQDHVSNLEEKREKQALEKEALS